MGNDELAKIGRELKRRRVAARLTQRQLGDLVGRTPQSISGYELGDDAPAPDIIEALDSALEAGGDLLARYGLALPERSDILAQMDAKLDEILELVRAFAVPPAERRLSSAEREASADQAIRAKTAGSRRLPKV